MALNMPWIVNGHLKALDVYKAGHLFFCIDLLEVMFKAIC